MVIDKIAILTSGGDCQGMNAVVNIVVRVATQKGIKVFGVRNGYQGLIDDDFSELQYEDVANIAHLGGTYLGTARCEEFKTEKGVQKAVENLTNRGIDALIVIGGDGSFNGELRYQRRYIKDPLPRTPRTQLCSFRG